MERQNKIRVNLFGCVRLTNGAVGIDEGMLHSNRLLTLLAYLILHREAPALNKVLCEQFIGDEYRNPEGTLKNLMCRLRRSLTMLGTDEYICTLAGGYRWNPEIQVETDYEQFDRLYEQFSCEQDVSRKKEICIEATECYQGNFSSGIAEEKWIIPLYMQYQAQYLEIVKALGDIYEAEGEWSLLEQLCRKALVSEMLEEDIHGRLIRSLQHQEKTGQALEHYEEAKKLFSENFGGWSPKKLQDSLTNLPEDPESHILSLAEIKRNLCEQASRKGAFFCGYQTFQMICRLEMRRIERLGISEYLLLLTLRRQGSLWKNAVVDFGMVRGLEVLEKILFKMLRAGDMVTQSSQTQFLILLPFCSYEAGVQVAERICKDFKKNLKRQKMELVYELEEVSFLREKDEVMER